MCLSVEDAALLYGVLRGHPESGRAGTTRGSRSAIRHPARVLLRSARLAGRCRDSTKPASGCKADGAVLEDVVIAHTKEIAAIYVHIALPEAAAYHAATLESRPQDYTENVRLRLEMGRYILAEDYVRAQRGRQVLTREVREALGGRDGLLLPSMPVPATRLGAATVSDRRHRGAGQEHHAAADAALQHHRASGDLAAVRQDRRGPAGRPADRRHQEPHARTAAGRRRLSKEALGARVLAPFFHAWERRLASVVEGSRRAAVRLGPRLARPQRPSAATPEERVAAWVDEAMQDTPAFFDLPRDVRLRVHRGIGGPAETGRSRHAAFPERPRHAASREQHRRRALVSGRGRVASRHDARAAGAPWS